MSSKSSHSWHRVRTVASQRMARPHGLFGIRTNPVRITAIQPDHLRHHTAHCRANGYFPPRDPIRSASMLFRFRPAVATPRGQSSAHV
ncbi:MULTISPECIES: hypothetical protein [Burkholderia]|uniref:hypothetical protein n=1 Tax=Burkholderia TaxID=32008 RepID=UPI00158DF93B|nr:hypothetical protein [Burkholderia ambifaria]